MKLIFWLLDANPKIDGDKIELWFWGIDQSGRRVLIIEKSFSAYFYATLENEFNVPLVIEEISQSFSGKIQQLEIVERRYFGKPEKTIKVYCKNATETIKIAKLIRSINGIKDCFEDDIRAVMRYLIDNNLAPCSWHEVEVVEEKNLLNIRIDQVYAAETPPKKLDNVVVPELRVVSFSIIYYSLEGSPKSNRNPVLIISTVASNKEEKQFVVNEAMNDKPVIEAFIGYIREFDPDIIVSFGANSMDWTYLRGRCHKLGIHLDFDRAQFEPHTSVYGHVSTTGIANVDLADFMDIFPTVKVRTLWNLSNHLGILKEKVAVDDVLCTDYWDDRQKREELKRFGIESARKISGVADLLLDFAMQLSTLTTIPLDHVMTAAVGFRVEWFLIKQAQKNGELIPKRIEQPYVPYVGGLVLSPKSGLHENIAVLDFKSMYPNIMLTYNLSPDTYLEPDEPIPSSGVFVAPEVGHRFCKSPPGFYKEAIMYLINIRNNIRQKMTELNPASVEYHVLDARQKAVKIITNAVYGYAGWLGARWYIKPVAEAASAWGRDTIQKAIGMSKNAGIEVIYGDTDSLFIKYHEDKALQLQEDIKRELKLEVEVGEVYQRIFFTEAKKRYAGLRHDGALDIVGLEVIRGDWSEVAKKVQEHVLELILKEQSPKKALDFVRETINNLRHRKVQLNDLIIWKTLTKKPGDYEIKAPHVEAAKMLKEKGWRLTGGDKIGYVVLSGKGRLYGRVKPYVFAKIEEVDVDYYITNQVLPAASRILVLFNVSKAELLAQTKEKQEAKSLMDYV